MSKSKRNNKVSLLRQIVRHVVGVVVPHQHNKYHPHIIRNTGLGVIALLASIGFMVALNSQRAAVLGAEPEITPAALLGKVNQERERAGHGDLVYNSKLAAAALAKGKDMLANQYWAHTSPDGISPWKWIQDEQYSYLYAGENLAKNFSSAAATVAAWMASPPHRENMLHDYYEEVGFAIVDGRLNGVSVTIVVALFATPATRAVVTAASTSSPDTGVSLSLLSRIGLSVQAMNPVLLGSIFLALLAISVAAVTFASTQMGAFRAWQAASAKRMKANVAWHRHHTIAKTAGLTGFVIVTVALFGGGQL